MEIAMALYGAPGAQAAIYRAIAGRGVKVTGWDRNVLLGERERN